jgi:molecular chaperone HscC
MDPDQAIALGAAVQAGLKARNSALKEVVLTDVCPYSLGIGAMNFVGEGHPVSIFEPIIERNTVIPASRVENFHTIKDKQTIINVIIYQGESRNPEENIRLGMIKLKVPPKPAGEETIDVRFTYDINGLLEVIVTVKSTGVSERLLIEDNPGSMTKQEIEERMVALAELKVHPRDQAPMRTLLARGERCYSQTLGSERDKVGVLLDTLQVALASQDPKGITRAVKPLSDYLDYLDQQVPFQFD